MAPLAVDFPAYRPWPHRLAWALVCATFPLIWLGGLVTTYDAGMAVPDWPNTYGYNLLLYPWSTWIFGPFDLLIEHGHRLLGAAVGMLTLATAGLLAWQEPRPWVRRLGLAAVAGVILQGGLGGLRVLADQRLVAQIHGCTGPAFLALAVSLAIFTSRAWVSDEGPAGVTDAARLQRLALGTTGLVYLQLVLGSYLRHLSDRWPSAVFQIVLLGHLLVAAALLGHALSLAVRMRRLPGSLSWLRRRAWLLGALLVGQVILGAATWVANYGWPAWARGRGPAALLTEAYVVTAEGASQAWITTAHVANGSLILVWALALALASLRWLKAEPGHSRSGRTTRNWVEAA